MKFKASAELYTGLILQAATNGHCGDRRADAVRSYAASNRNWSIGGMLQCVRYFLDRTFVNARAIRWSAF
jgi:hypothetical protein